MQYLAYYVKYPSIRRRHLRLFLNLSNLYIDGREDGCARCASLLNEADLKIKKWLNFKGTVSVISSKPPSKDGQIASCKSDKLQVSHVGTLEISFIVPLLR